MAVLTPRIWICTPPPGAPELVWMLAPGTLPCSASSTVVAGARVSATLSTTAVDVGAFFLRDPGRLSGDHDLLELRRVVVERHRHRLVVGGDASRRGAGTRSPGP